MRLGATTRFTAVAAVVAAACGDHTAPPPPRDAPAMAAARPDAGVELPARPLGLPDVGGFAWRKRGGQAEFRAAQVAERAGDWAAVAHACDRALAADPGHLDAQWLLAIAYAKQGLLRDVTGPLAIAAAGDFGKWADASLVHPALAAYLATPAGQAWRRWVERARAPYLAALRRAIVVDAGGELFAYDAAGAPPRWYRLTHENGRVIGAFASGRVLAYVARGRAGALGAGVIDLDDGHTTHAVPVGAFGAELAVVREPAGSDGAPGFWIGQGAAARELALDGSTRATGRKRPGGPWLYVGPRGAARAIRVPIAGVAGDWDDHQIASAIKLAATGRVITVPSPGVIAGNTIAWSPDRTHLAFVAQIADQCAPNAPAVAAFVADAATGSASELATASKASAVEWIDDRRVAVAGDAGVAIYAIEGGAPLALAGSTGLAAPAFRARCAAADSEPALPETEPEPEADPDGSGSAD